MPNDERFDLASRRWPALCTSLGEGIEERQQSRVDGFWRLLLGPMTDIRDQLVSSQIFYVARHTFEGLGSHHDHTISFAGHK